MATQASSAASKIAAAPKTDETDINAVCADLTTKWIVATNTHSTLAAKVELRLPGLLAMKAIGTGMFDSSGIKDEGRKALLSTVSVIEAYNSVIADLEAKEAAGGAKVAGQSEALAWGIVDILARKLAD